MSCAARIQGDLLITIPEESRAHKQIIRKTATERVIEVDPAVRQVYVEVDQARLGEHRGDWGRLQDAIEDQWGLTGLTIDLSALQKLQKNIRDGHWAVTVTIWNEQEVIDIQPGYQDGTHRAEGVRPFGPEPLKILPLPIPLGDVVAGSDAKDILTGLCHRHLRSFLPHDDDHFPLIVEVP